jgi:hypothetical protein
MALTTLKVCCASLSKYTTGSVFELFEKGEIF